MDEPHVRLNDNKNEGLIQMQNFPDRIILYYIMNREGWHLQYVLHARRRIIHNS